VVDKLLKSTTTRHIQFLWNAKLRSRNSFLLVLEHLPLNRTGLSRMLKMLKPAGSLFFNNYISKNYQFLKSDIRASQPIRVNSEKGLQIITCDWYPSLETVQHLSKKQLSKLRLTELQYFAEYCCIHSLYFIFSDGSCSPPPGLYEDEPNRKFLLAQAWLGGKLELAMCRCKSNFKLCVINILDSTGRLIVHL